MNIGLDFDGVISDCGRLKAEAAKRMYGIAIHPDNFKTELVVGKGILTLEQYRALQKRIYETVDFAQHMLPVDGVFEYMPRLQEEGHCLSVITSRGEQGCAIARRWMEKHNLSLSLKGVGSGVPKTEACRGLEVYVDDDLDKLQPLVSAVPHRYLFSWGYNQHTHNSAVAERVTSWKELYERIQLQTRNPPMHA